MGPESAFGPLPLWLNWLLVHASGFVLTLLFGLLGIWLMVFGFRAFEKATPTLNVEQELANKNYAVAIVLAAMFLGLSQIIVRSMS